MPPQETGKMLLHALFEEQARRSPSTPAIVFDDGTLTYAELDRRANRLAHRLRRMGVRPDSRVALLCERSLRTPVAMLGILKAGAAWLPLDADDTSERRRQVRTDGAPVVLLAEESRLEREAASPPILLMDELEQMLASEPETAPVTAVTSANAAYVIFTSGSTGRPKGVVNEHRGIVNHVRWMQEFLPLRTGDRVLQKTPFSFDVSVWEIFWPLTAGATLVMAPPGAHRDPVALARTIARERITTVHFVPSMLRPFLEVEQKLLDGCEALRRCICSGEALPRDLIDRWHASMGVPLFNLYGPTETAVHVSWRECQPGETGAVPIGYPVGNTRLAIVDENLYEVPRGATGELAIGGVQVGRGYVGRSDLTAERFVPDPFGMPGERLYLTGDLARLNENGEVEYLGRIDNQMKIRGVRVEAEEVETALRACRGVRDAAVAVRQFGPGDDRLVAWIVCDGRPPAGAELHRLMSERVPEAMVPSQFIPVDALPRTTSGKVNRNALPFAAVVLAPRAGRTLPQSERERSLAAVWEEVLRVSGVGVDDDFIADLRGGSLQAARIAATLCSRLGLDVSVADILQTRTIAALAATLAPGSGTTTHAIPKEHNRSEWPLSMQQEGFWFLGNLESRAHSFNIPLVLRLSRDVDVNRLTAAMTTFFQRHPVLRVVFRSRQGELVQFVDRRRTRHVEVVDLENVPEPERVKELRRLRTAIASVALDMDRGDVARLAIVRLGPSEYELLATFHHAVFDGESVAVFRNELERIYAADENGLPEPARPPVDYFDYAVWQRRTLADAATTAADLEYWRETLSGANYGIDLPAAHVPTFVTNAGAHAERIIDSALSATIRQVCSAEGVTQYTFLLSAFAILLHRYSGQNDIIIGSPFAGRTRPELQALIGCFINTLPLRLDLGGAPSCRDVLQRAWERVVGALRHQDTPAATLVRELAVSRESPSTPLFQVLFNHLGAAIEPGGHCPRLGLEVVGPPVPTDISRLDLSLYASDAGETIRLDAVYRSDRFTAEQIATALDHVVAILRQMTDDLSRPVSQLTIARPLPPTPIRRERERVPLMTCIGEIARRQPHATAVAHGADSISYGELAEASRRLAGAVAAAGVRPGDRVALLVRHDGPVALAMLGTLAAGATYVPLNPHDPDRRLRTVLEDAHPSLLLADTAHLDRAVAVATNLCATMEVSASPPPAHDAVPDDPAPETAAAYLLYTSGSTGKPKGVIQSRRNLLHHARTYAESIGIAPNDRVGLTASYTSDAAVMDIFGALTSGASLHPYDLREHGFTRLGAWLSAEGITVFHSTPTVFRHLMEVIDERTDLAALRWIVLGGEPMERHDLLAFQERLPRHVRLVNGLGPTESTTALQQFLDHDSTVVRMSVPVGHPVRDTDVSLWNDAGEQGALYGIGEIVIRSPYVALGYWGHDQLTRERFLPPDEWGRRGYRTGDIGRWLPGGTLEFVGRRDNQVKIRGHRVELEEIVARMLEQPYVAAAAVKPVGRGPDRALAAFFVSRAAEPVAADQLKKALEDDLPQYMVPAFFIQLAEMPLTATGKIDLGALRVPDQQVDAEPAPVSSDPIESELCAIWRSVLGVPAVAPDANFFALGGDSLLAMKAAFHTQKRLGVDLPLRDFFAHPVPVELARAVRSARDQVRPQPPSLKASLRRRYEPVSLQQLQMFRFSAGIPNCGAYSNMIDCLAFDGPLSVGTLSDAVNVVRQRHETLRTVFVTDEDDVHQMVLSFRAVPLRLIEVQHLPAAERALAVEAIARNEQQTPFVLSQEPVLRLFVVREAEQRHLLFLVTHHLTFDRWAKVVFYNELLRAYEALQNGVSHGMPPLAVQYADYARWQRECRRQRMTEDDLRYWTTTLGDCTGGPVLAMARKQLTNASSRGAVASRTFPHELLHRLRELSRQEGATLFMTVLAAFYVLLHRHSNNCDLVVGSPIAGRPRPELEPLIGFFANSVLLRIALSPEWSFRRLLGAVAGTAAEAYSHQEVHFDEVLQAIGRPEIYRIKFALQDIPGLKIFPWRNGELTADLLPIEAEERTRRDLNVYLVENERGLSVEILYRAEVFDASAIDDLLEDYQRILADAVTDPATPVVRLGSRLMVPH